MICISKILNWIRRIVAAGVALLLGWMVILALSQVILRWFFSMGIPWADQQLRMLVLWVGLLGGVLTSAQSRHIRIDLLDHYLKVKFRQISRHFIDTIAGLGALYLAYLSIAFVISEKESGLKYDSLLFGASIPYWVTELIIPVGFALIGLFFLIPNTADQEIKKQV